jgi:fatty acid desaturase
MLQTGMPAELYRIHHVLIHHKLNNRPEDWTGPFSFKGTTFPSRPVGLLKYVVTFIPRAWTRSLRVLKTGGSVRRRRTTFALTVLVLYHSLLLATAPEYLACIVAPSVALFLLTPLANWLHHSSCSYSTWDTSAHTSLVVLNRKLGFNIGYHATHHRSPSTHWSDIPSLHDRFLAEEKGSAAIDPIQIPGALS